MRFTMSTRYAEWHGPFRYKANRGIPYEQGYLYLHAAQKSERSYLPFNFLYGNHSDEIKPTTHLNFIVGGYVSYVPPRQALFCSLPTIVHVVLFLAIFYRSSPLKVKYYQGKKC